MPQVSVIIPAYNGDRFIVEALESVFQQTFCDYEVIVVNDGSTDSTATVLAPYRDRIHYLDQHRQGVAAARNRGLAVAQGEWVAFLDQDDVWLPQKLALQIRCFTQPSIGMVHSGWRLIDAAGRWLGAIEPWHEVPELHLIGWLRRMPVLLSAMLFRRSWLDQVGGFSLQWHQVSDVELIQRLLVAGCQTVWLRQITVFYRQHDRNDSLNTRIQAAEVWAVQQRLFARSDLSHLLLQHRQSECRYYTAVWLSWRLYHTCEFELMVVYLEQALIDRPATWTEAILQWIRLFRQYEADYGRSFDLEALTQRPEWQRLIASCTALQLNCKKPPLQVAVEAD